MTVETCDSGDTAVHGETGVLISPGDQGLQAAAGRLGGPVHTVGVRVACCEAVRGACVHSKARLRTRVLHDSLSHSANVP